MFPTMDDPDPDPGPESEDPAPISDPEPCPGYQTLARTVEPRISTSPTVELHVVPQLPPIPHPYDPLDPATLELNITISPTVEFPKAIKPPPIPEPYEEVASTVESPIIIEPILEPIGPVGEELDPDPIPDPPFSVDELFAMTKEFRSSKPAIIEYPLVNEPPPMADPVLCWSDP
jgi:hypothetical protein